LTSILHLMELNKDAIAEFLSLGYILGDYTFRKGEKNKNIIDIPEIKTFNATISDVGEALKKSISTSVKDKEKVAVLLSGGKDARLLVGLAHSLGIDVSAVNIGDKRNRSEEKVAYQVAKALNIPFKVVHIPEEISPTFISEIVEQTDGLISFTGVTPTYFIRNELSKDFDILLTGNLMTEIMDTCEYRWYDSKDPVEVMKRKHMKGNKVLIPEYAKKVEEHFMATFKDKSLEQIILETEFRNRSLYMKTLNKLMDIPFVAPVADKDVISATFSLPLKQRMNGKLATSILKKSYPSLVAIPMSKTRFPLFFPWWLHYGTYTMKDRIGYFRSGKKIWNGEPRTNKMGMWDQGYVYKYKIGDYVKHELESLDLDIINEAFVKEILQKHFSETADQSGYIPRLLTLKNWLDKNT
jgi:asparagine synthetase B (glutamine-hydrolysing)